MRLLLPALALPVLLLGACSQDSVSDPPNIVLVMADDQGWGDVAYNDGSPLETPHLDEMAASGLRFDRFYAAAPVCSPTRGSVMTGRHPNRFGCFSWGHTLRPQETTIAELLKEAGYSTGHFGKWHLGSVRQGSPVNPGASGFDEWLSSPNFFDNDPILSREGRAVPLEGESSLITAEAALEFMGDRSRQEAPFLAVVWFGSPHAPHEALPEFRERYPDESEALQNFYGEITALDQAVGRLRKGLEELGIRENTLLWYCSDNGALPIGSAGGFRGKKGDLYEGGLLVPAVLEWPRLIRRARTTSIRSYTSDILPTIADLLGLATEDLPEWDGISLAPVIRGREVEREQGMGFWAYPAPGVVMPSRQWMSELLEAQRQGREPDDEWKLRLDAGEIRKRYPLDEFPGHSAWIDGYWKLHRIDGEEGVRFELYDLASDPYETEDLGEGEPERVNRMRTELEEWLRSVVRSLNGEDYR